MRTTRRLLAAGASLIATGTLFAACDTAEPNTAQSQVETSTNAQNSTWQRVFEYTARQGDDPHAESERFTLDGPSRLIITTTGTANAESPGTPATVMFQDIELNTESSRVDTILDIDDVGTIEEDLGERTGEYFLMIQANGGRFVVDELGGSTTKGWSDVQVTVVVEQLK
ncbi:hypothetical protein ACEE18_00940 [Corynebacterium freneyi]